MDQQVVRSWRSRADRPAARWPARVERRFVVFAGLGDYADVLPELFPWADLIPDEELLDQHDEDLWMEETGIWDSEDKQYIGNIETMDEWRAGRFGSGRLRAYTNVADEVDLWRLSLALNDLGRGVLALERYLRLNRRDVDSARGVSDPQARLRTRIDRATRLIDFCFAR